MKTADEADSKLSGSVTELKNTYESLTSKIRNLETTLRDLRNKNIAHDSFHNSVIDPHVRNNEPMSNEKMKADIPSIAEINHPAASIVPNAASLLGNDTVLLIIASNRPEYLKKTLDLVLNYHPKYKLFFPIFCYFHICLTSVLLISLL